MLEASPYPDSQAKTPKLAMGRDGTLAMATFPILPNGSLRQA